jgi:hypothetical protein
MAHQAGVPYPVLPETNPSADLVKLIRKLRWIGLEDEARQLEIAASKIPPDIRAVVAASGSETD